MHLVRYVTVITHGGARVIKVSLPFVRLIAGKGRYRKPPPLERRERGPAMSERNIRRALGKDPEYNEKLRDAVVFAATLRRIASKGF
jgi:hypothetical protein